MEIEMEDSGKVEMIQGIRSSLIPAYQMPAIRITESCGESEITREFATADDYRAWKELEKSDD